VSKLIFHKLVCNFLVVIAVFVFAICAGAQDVSQAAIQKAIDNLSPEYKDVPSSISCKAPASQAEKIICADPLLRLMERLDTMASIYMVENGTHRPITHNRKTVLEESLIKTIRKLKSAEAIRKAYIENTNNSLGGESPYYVGDDN
jgi:hypothetical protein